MRTVRRKLTSLIFMLALGAAMSSPALSQGGTRRLTSTVIYGLDGYGTLKWHRYDQTETGDGTEPSGVWIGPKNVGVGWDKYARVFPGGADIIYGIKPDGTLEWIKHRGFASGDDAWEAPKNVGRGWESFKHVFSGGDGYIYGISQDGRLWWYHHIAYRTGGALDAPGAWEGRTVVGRGWESFKHVFSGGDGYIYAITPDGRLWWYHHIAYRTGGTLETPGAWEGRTVVGRGWESFSHVFSTGGGYIYAVSPDGRVWLYRHIAYRTGGMLETPGAWGSRTVIGQGWGDFNFVFALMPFNDEESALPGVPAPGGVPAPIGVPAPLGGTPSGASDTTGSLARHGDILRRRSDTRLAERHGAVVPDTSQPSNQLLCRGSDERLRVGDSQELKDFYEFRILSSRFDSTGAAILTVELGGNPGYVAAGSDGAGLKKGQCAWMDRPPNINGGVRVRFEVPANAQLIQARQGTPVDTSPTAAERFPDASNIPLYLTNASNYWVFTAYDTGQGYMQATAGRHWKRTPGLGDAVTQPLDNRGVRKP